jgi:ankyrin repeat protein
MNVDEMNAELLECARYGENEDLAQLLQQPGVNVDFVDVFSGNTALHRAAANGEVECIRVLKSHNAQRLPNLSGNYPERE